MTLDEAINHCIEVAERYETRAKMIDRRKLGSALENPTACHECAADHRQLAKWLTELKEVKRLLRLAVEDFAKLDRVNTKVRNCMIPDMDCADCPLSWDSVDDSVEPCHSWRYADEALTLIGEDGDTE